MHAGLSDAEVERRRETFGFNELPEKKVNPLLVFLGHFWGPMPIMIWIAILIEGPVMAIANPKKVRIEHGRTNPVPRLATASIRSPLSPNTRRVLPLATVCICPSCIPIAPLSPQHAPLAPRISLSLPSPQHPSPLPPLATCNIIHANPTLSPHLPSPRILLTRLVRTSRARTPGSTRTKQGGDWADFAVLLILQIVNGMVGWYEGVKAGNAVAALKESLGTSAYVRRNGKWTTAPTRELVPGDIVQLALGGGIPADCQLLDGKVIAVDQAALTGESMPVKMTTGDVAKMGSNVTQGEIDAVVRHTGAKTFFGKTAAMLNQVESKGHFEILLWRITLFLMGFSFIFVSIILVYMLLTPQAQVQDESERILGAISKCVVLLIASIPIAMQVVCTSTMAIGARRLAQKKAVVTRLGAIEELAGMDMLCSDKTGTLTTGKMEMQEPNLFGDVFTKQDILRDACLSARWQEDPKDAIDTLVLKYCAADLDGYTAAFEQPDYVPFDPSVKRTEATLRPTNGDPEFRCTKGAPHIILQMAHNHDEIAEEVNQKIEDLAQRGTRALGVARTDAEGKWCFTGILTFLDPPRHDTKETLDRAKALGVEIKMITGDHVAIAKETCFKLGLGTNIKGTDVLPGNSNDLALASSSRFGELCEEADGFGEVFPEHKYMIVEVLQRRGWTTGMTGDGVNDAPALKRADIGIAVQGATDAARAAADIVLTEPGLSVIIDAIVYSRKIFHRMKNYVTYRIACTLQLLVFFFIAILFMHPNDFHDFRTGYNHSLDQPCDYVHANANGTGAMMWLPRGCADVEQYFALPVIALVVITILNDGTIITIARDKVIPGSTPEKWMLWHVITVATLLGMIACGSSILLLQQAFCTASDEILGAFNWGGAGGKTYHPTCGTEAYIKNNHVGDTLFSRMGALGKDGKGFTIEQARTVMYLKISLSDFLTVFSARTRGPFFERRPGYGLLTAFIVATTTSTILACSWPSSSGRSDGPSGSTEDPMHNIEVKEAGLIWAYCLFWFLVGDFGKWALNKVIFTFFVKPELKGHTDDRAQMTKNRRALAAEKMGRQGSLATIGDTSDSLVVPRTAEEFQRRVLFLTENMTKMNNELRFLQGFANRSASGATPSNSNRSLLGETKQ